MSRTASLPFLFKGIIPFLASLLIHSGLNAQCAYLAPPVEESFDMSTMPPGCWTTTTVSGSGWETGQQGDAGYGASTISEHTGNGGYYAWVDFSSTEDTAWLTSPKVDVSGMTQNPQVVYWVFSNNTNSSGNNTLQLQAYDGTNWVTVQSHQQNNPDWVKKTADLSAYIFNDTVQVRIGGLENASMTSPYHNDLLLDDIEIRETPTCPQPTSLTTNALSSDSVVLDWVSNGTGTDWEIQYGPSGFALGNGTSFFTPDRPDTLTGLSANTTYDVYVREICGAGDTSAWSGPLSFTTPCLSAYSAVYSTGFDQSNSNTPVCWSKIDPNSNVELVTSTGHDDNLSPVSTTQMVELNDGNISTGDTAMVVSPKLIGLGDGDKQIKVHVNREDGGSSEFLIIGTLSDTSNSATWTPYDTIPTDRIPTNAWAQRTIEFKDTSTIGSDEYIGIAHGAGSYELYLDNFRYEFIPDTNVGITALESPLSGECQMDPDSVTIEISNEGTDPQSGFDVAYSVNGGAPVVETVSQTIPAYGEITYTFSPTSAFAGNGTYDVTAYTTLSGDSVFTNDTLSSSVTNGSGSLVPNTSASQGVPDGDATLEDTLFICGASHQIYECGRILSLTIDSLHHEDALDELEIRLISPEGTTLNLWMQLGSPSEQVMDDLVFSDTASQNISTATGSPYSGAYHPQETAGFAKFQGEQLNGMWRLRIFNDDSFDTASFHGWNMRAIDPTRPQPDLGPDTTICQRENLLLDPGNGPDWSYVWGDNSTDSTKAIAGSLLDTNTSYTYTVTVTDEDPLNKCSNSDTIQVMVENCTGIESRSEKDLSFKIHPNPATSELTIINEGSRNGSFRYELFDLKGRKLKQSMNKGKQRSSMDVSHLSKGVYILKGYRRGTEHPLFQQKVIVQ